MKQLIVSGCSPKVKCIRARLDFARLIGILVIAFVCIAIGAETYTYFMGRHQAQQIQQADTDHQAAAVARTEAVTHDAQASKDGAQQRQDDAQASGASSDVAQADAKVARLRKASAPAPQPPPAPGVPAPQPAAPPVDLAPLVAAQDEEIAALKAQHTLDLTRLADRDKLISSLTLARDSWHTSADQSAAEAVQLRAALAAQKGLIRAAEIKGFLWGFATGGATGAGAITYLKR